MKNQWGTQTWVQLRSATTEESMATVLIDFN